MRSIWKGAISFLFVSIPVKVYNALETSEKISFNQLHAGTCLGPIGYTKQCKTCGETVVNEQIVKGYQHEPDKYVVVTSEEISSIAPESNHAIQITGFINLDEIPTTYLDASYFASPDGSAAGKPYTLLRDALKRTSKVAIGKVILREREELVTIFPEGEGLIIQKLRYRHQVREIDDMPGLKKLPETLDNEIALAENLIETMKTTFAEIDTEDHFHTALKQMLETKASGGTITVNNQKQKPEENLDIMTALRQSLSAMSQPKPEPSTPEITAQPNQTTLTLVPPDQNKQNRKKKVA